MLRVDFLLRDYLIGLNLTDHDLKSLCDSLEKCYLYPSLSFTLTPVFCRSA